jgi:hypothetical protein
MTNPPPDREDDGSVDVEAAWADIVAHWNTEDERVGGWPAQEDAEASSEKPAADVPDVTASAPSDDRPDAGDTATEDWGVVSSHVGGERARNAARRDQGPDDEEGYVPPEPPPLPRGDAFTMLAWAGVLGAPLFFLFTALFWRTVPQLLIVGAIAAFIGGFITLVLRMPDHRDDDPDDGAVV